MALGKEHFVYFNKAIVDLLLFSTNYRGY